MTHETIVNLISQTTALLSAVILYLGQLWCEMGELDNQGNIDTRTIHRVLAKASWLDWLHFRCHCDPQPDLPNAVPTSVGVSLREPNLQREHPAFPGEFSKILILLVVLVSARGFETRTY